MNFQRVALSFAFIPLAALAACKSKTVTVTQAAGSGSAAPAAPVSPTAPPPPAPEAFGHCEFSVTGAATKHGRSAGDQGTLGSDYFMTPDEVKTGIDHANASKSDAERAALLATEMKRDPRMYIFMSNCKGDGVSLTFTPTAESHYADVPMAAKKYPIATKEQHAGEINALATVDNKPYQATGGSFDIASFSPAGMKANFSFTAQKMGGTDTVTVQGTIDYGCAWPLKLCQDARKK